MCSHRPPKPSAGDRKKLKELFVAGWSPLFPPPISGFLRLLCLSQDEQCFWPDSTRTWTRHCARTTSGRFQCKAVTSAIRAHHPFLFAVCTCATPTQTESRVTCLRRLKLCGLRPVLVPAQSRHLDSEIFRGITLLDTGALLSVVERHWTS